MLNSIEHMEEFEAFKNSAELEPDSRRALIQDEKVKKKLISMPKNCWFNYKN